MLTMLKKMIIMKLELKRDDRLFMLYTLYLRQSLTSRKTGGCETYIRCRMHGKTGDARHVLQ